MKLQIINSSGTFEVIGNLTLNNSELVKDHFNYLLDHYEEVVMSLKKVKKIDKKAIKVLKEIYAKANRRSKILFVLGKENNVIANAFKKNKADYIFREDY
jgi:anti-anti-sigma regulatory factor